MTKMESKERFEKTRQLIRMLRFSLIILFTKETYDREFAPLIEELEKKIHDRSWVA